MNTAKEIGMNWIVYDQDFQRSKSVVIMLFARCGIQALVYEEAIKMVNFSSAGTNLLVHCEALDKNFVQLALIKQTGKCDFRFYCTEERDRIPQIAYLPDEWKRLVS